MMLKTKPEVRAERLRVRPDVGLLTIAALWPKKGNNLGTLVRTCDALRTRLVVPRDSNARAALAKGNTIGNQSIHIDLIDGDPYRWLRLCVTRLVGVELAHGATPLKDVEPATSPTTILLGNEAHGIPDRALAMCDEIVEIPMLGMGNSLNVAVAGSLVAYKLAGLS